PDDILAAQETAISKLDLDALLDVTRTIEKGESKSRNIEVSHWVLRYEVRRGNIPGLERVIGIPKELARYRESMTELVPSSTSSIEKVKERISKLKEGELLEILRPEFSLLKSPVRDISRATYQAIFAEWLTNGESFVSWQFELGVQNGNNWDSIQVPNFSRKDRSDISWKEMKEGVLYYPLDSFYPFVDMFWKKGKELHCVQVTISPSHEKSFSTFEEKLLKRRLGAFLVGSGRDMNGASSLDPVERVKMYYAHPPLSAEETKRSGRVTEGKIWKKISDREREISRSRMNFALLYLAPESSKQKDLRGVGVGAELEYQR
ncbi:MAG: hypothetical protein AAGM67_19765, partial [Bacteroidota bacterium]